MSDMLKFMAMRGQELENQKSFRKSFEKLNLRAKNIHSYYQEVADISYSPQVSKYNAKVLSFLNQKFPKTMSENIAEDVLKLANDFFGEILEGSAVYNRLIERDEQLLRTVSEFVSLSGEAPQ